MVVPVTEIQRQSRDADLCVSQGPWETLTGLGDGLD